MQLANSSSTLLPIYIKGCSGQVEDVLLNCESWVSMAGQKNNYNSIFYILSSGSGFSIIIIIIMHSRC